MILVTGAAGKTGMAIIRQLAAKEIPVRAFVHRETHAESVRQHGAAQVFIGDLYDSQAVSAAMVGVRAVYHICPNVNPDEFTIGKTIIDTAVSAGVEQFVFHSVLHPQVEAMPHHWEKMRVEAYLFQSQMPFTILQPVAYMQNVLAQWENIIQQGAYTVPYGEQTRLGMVDLADVAEAAATVLTEPGHIGATYELATDERLSQVEVAAVLSETLARPVSVQRTPLEAWVSRAEASGLGGYQIDTLVKMFKYYDRFGFWGNGRVLTWLLGRQPTSFAGFIRRQVKGG